MTTVRTAPRGFKTLIPSPVMYYKVEEDGGVMITGPNPARCLFNETLPDGSQIQGGWTTQQGGTVFGDRIIFDSLGNRSTKPLRWCDIDEAEALDPPSERRKPVGPNPRKNVRPERSKPKPEPQNMMPEVRDMLNAYEREAADKARAEAQNNRWRQRMAVQPKEEGKRKRKPAMSRPDVDPSKVIAGLKTENERLQREHKQMQEEVKMMTDQLRRMHEKNEEFKDQAKTIRDDALSEVKKIRDDYNRKSRIHRWQIEAAPSKDKRVEGLEAKIWEIEDPDKEMRYLIVASTPRGTEKRVEEQWMADLKSMLEGRFGDSMYYVIVPPGTDITVREVQPGIDQIDEAADYGQF